MNVLVPVNHTDAHSLFFIALVPERENICQFDPFDCPLNYCIKCKCTRYLIAIKDYILKHKEVEGPTSVLLLRLTKPTAQKFNKDKICVDILLSNDNLFY